MDDNPGRVFYRVRYGQLNIGPCDGAGVSDLPAGFTVKRRCLRNDFNLLAGLDFTSLNSAGSDSAATLNTENVLDRH